MAAPCCKCGGEKLDLILRDVDVVEYCTRRSERGEFEVDPLLGYIAGIPTYTLRDSDLFRRRLRLLQRIAKR